MNESGVAREDEMYKSTRVRCASRFDLGMLVTAAAISKVVHVEIIRHSRVDVALSRPKRRLTAKPISGDEYRAGEPFRRGEQCCRAVSVVVERGTVNAEKNGRRPSVRTSGISSRERTGSVDFRAGQDAARPRCAIYRGKSNCSMG
jgi:hypothetical protein